MRDCERYPALAAECIEAFWTQDREGERQRLMFKAGARLIADALVLHRRTARVEG